MMLLNLHMPLQNPLMACLSHPTPPNPRMQPSPTHNLHIQPSQTLNLAIRVDITTSNLSTVRMEHHLNITMLASPQDLIPWDYQCLKLKGS